MSVLSDTAIRYFLKHGDLEIDPLEPEQIGPASVDLRLDHDIQIMFTQDLYRHQWYGKPHSERAEAPRRFDAWHNAVPYALDPKRPETLAMYTQDRFIGSEGLALSPGQFALGTTVEKVRIPLELIGRVTGRSSIGRLGIAVHITAGFIDPGFEGHITLEIANHGSIPVVLHAHMRLCQLILEHVDGKVTVGYGDRPNSKYQLQTKPTLSRIAEDFQEPTDE